MSVNVYVDGFNLYNGMFKSGRSPASSKWLDLGLLATTVWPHLGTVNRVRYFAARLKPTLGDPLIVDRQDIYLRALEAHGILVHLGQFKKRFRKWSLSSASSGTILEARIKITKYEEKGSDVNLGAYMVRDAAVKDCTEAIVISNDSDLVEAIQISQRDFSVPVYIVNPQVRAVAELTTVAAGSRDLAPSALAKSQLPVSLTDKNGNTITRPPSWV